MVDTAPTSDPWKAASRLRVIDQGIDAGRDFKRGDPSTIDGDTPMVGGGDGARPVEQSAWHPDPPNRLW